MPYKYNQYQRHQFKKGEISSFGKKIIIAFINDECPPILCRRINYLEDKQYQGKFDDNPLQK